MIIKTRWPRLKIGISKYYFTFRLYAWRNGHNLVSCLDIIFSPPFLDIFLQTYMYFYKYTFLSLYTQLSNLNPLGLINIFFAILSSFIRSTCPNQLRMFFFIFTVTSSLVPAILCISSLQNRSAKLTPHILRRDRISTAFIFLSFFFCNTHVSLPYNRVE